MIVVKNGIMCVLPFYAISLCNKIVTWNEVSANDFGGTLLYHVIVEESEVINVSTR
jgi:hypothetical protein